MISNLHRPFSTRHLYSSHDNHRLGFVFNSPSLLRFVFLHCSFDLIISVFNNQIQLIEDLVPLAQLKLVSLDLYKCHVMQLKDYRSRVFGLVKSLNYLDKMDAEENERPESDIEEDDEIDGEERPNVMSNGHSERLEGAVEVDEEESESNEEDTETGRQSDGVSDHANGLRDGHLNDDSDEEDGEDEYVSDGFIVDDTQEIDEEDVVEGEEEVDIGVPSINWLQRDIDRAHEGYEEDVVEAEDEVDIGIPPVNWLQRDINREFDDYEEDEYVSDGFLVDDTHDIDEGDVVEDKEEVDIGVPPRNWLQRDINRELDGYEEDGEDEYVSDGFLVDDTQDIEGEEEVDLGVQPMNWLQREINGELDDHDEVAEAGREPNWMTGFVVSGAQNVLLNMDEEENDDNDEENEYEPDGFLIDEEDVGEGEEEVDLGVPHRNEFLMRNIIIREIDRHEQDEGDGGSWEEEEGVEEDEEYGAGCLAQPVAEAIQVDEEEEYEDDEVQVVCSVASSNLKRQRDEDDDRDYVSSSSDNNDDEGLSEDVSSDDDE